MNKRKVTVSFHVPRGMYCNFSMSQSKRKNKCRMCVESSKNTYTCVIDNTLLATHGHLVQKSEACQFNVNDIEADIYIDPADIVSSTADMYHKTFKELNKKLPAAIANDVARKEIKSLGKN